MRNETTWVDQHRSRKKRSATTILSLIAIITTTGFVWASVNYRSAKAEIALLSRGGAHVDDATEKEVEQLVKRVRQHLLLPQDVEPTVATVQNAAALAAEQRFFQDAENGDAVLIYPDRAILFSAEQDVIVNVAPVQINRQQSDTAGERAKEDPALTAPRPVTIEIRNGGDTEGAAQRVATLLETDGRYQVVAIGNAVTDEYIGMTLVANTDVDLGDIERRFDVAAVKDLPDGEAATTADILIIVGN